MKIKRPVVSLLVASFLTSATLLASSDGWTAGRRGGKTPTAQGSFIDHFNTFDSARWMKADGWTNGPPFDNAWTADHIYFSDGVMHIVLDDESNLGEPYTSGNYQSNGFYGYGCYEASFVPVAVSGVVSSFFTFAGPFDNGGNGKHNEIDYEFIKGDPWYVQTNFWTNDDAYAGGNEEFQYLGFDASQNFNRYGFKWTSLGIDWYVNGIRIGQVLDTASNPTPKTSDSLQKIMMNVWPVDETAALWAGYFEYPGHPLEGLYDWVRYIEGQDCSLADPPDPPPPAPEGQASEIHVADVAMAVDSRATQVIARVTIVNGLGEPEPDVDVSGVWSGIITGGDGQRVTDSDGIATFYSRRSRDSGEVRFCVTGVSAAGREYRVDQNLEECDAITK